MNNFEKENTTQQQSQEDLCDQCQSQENLPHVMRNKNYLLLWLGAAVSNIAATFYHFAISFYILSITNNSATFQGIYLFTVGIVFVLSSIFCGVLADRWNKVKIIYICDYVRGFFVILAAVVIFFASRVDNVTIQIVVLFVVGIVFNIVSAIFNPAINSVLPRLVHPLKLQQANSYFSILNSIQSILGILLASALYAALPVYLLFGIVGICYIASGVSEMFIRYNHKKPSSPLNLSTFFADFKDGFKCLAEKKAIVILVLCILFINFFFSPVFSNGIPYFIKVYVADADYLFSWWKNSQGESIVKPESWSALFSVFNGIGSLIMGFIVGSAAVKAGTKYYKKINLWIIAMSLCLVVMTLSFIFFVQKSHLLNVCLPVFCGVSFGMGISVVGVNVPIMTVIQSSIEQDRLAKVWSLINIGSQGLIPIASLLGGLMIDNLGLGVMFAFSAVGFSVMSVLMCLSKSIKSL